MHGTLPTEAAARKAVPIATGCVDYFPDALAAVAELSKKGNDQHNPGSPLHWDRSKSTDEADALMRHFVERGTHDSDGIRHSAKVAWRALALLQKELEAERNERCIDGGIIEVDIRAGETLQQAADRALRDHQSRREFEKLCDEAFGPRPLSDRLTSLQAMQRREPALSRHGFTDGETVNTKQSRLGHRPGIVVGFGDHTDILVEWPSPTGDSTVGYFPADDLRHGP